MLKSILRGGEWRKDSYLLSWIGRDFGCQPFQYLVWMAFTRVLLCYGRFQGPSYNVGEQAFLSWLGHFLCLTLWMIRTTKAWIP
jgi:hypothetical protein